MRYASVCDGIGAVHVAWHPLGWECAWTSEIEPFPADVVDHHWKLKNLGDMTALTEEMLNDCGPISLLCGGTPCQSFSVAGLRKGLADPRGNLALRFVQLVGVLRPEWVVWENVPGVLSSEGGRDFGTFLGALAELGYGFAYRVLDAQWFGVAQRRRRVFVVANARDWRRSAAVLFERESLFGNPPTRDKAWQGVARSTASSLTGSGRGVERCRESRGQDDVVLWRGGDQRNSEVCRDHAGTLNCNKGQQGGIVAFKEKMSVPDATVGLGTTLQAENYHAVAFTKAKRAQSVTDDESWQPGDVAPTQSCFDQGDTRATTVVAYDVHGTLAAKGASETDIHSALRGRIPGQSEASTTTVVACDGRNQSGRTELHHSLRTSFDAGDCIAVGSDETAGTLRANQGSGWRSNGTPVEGVAIQGMAVRRLTPVECERLQGFPDGYTNVIYRKRPAADGPRYKALGNSMAVPVMRWIGQRIAAIEASQLAEVVE